jgi:hypothetical protein
LESKGGGAPAGASWHHAAQRQGVGCVIAPPSAKRVRCSQGRGSTAHAALARQAPLAPLYRAAPGGCSVQTQVTCRPRRGWHAGLTAAHWVCGVCAMAHNMRHTYLHAHTLVSPHITHHTSHITHHTSHITHHTLMHHNHHTLRYTICLASASLAVSFWLWIFSCSHTTC